MWNEFIDLTACVPLNSNIFRVIWREDLTLCVWTTVLLFWWRNCDWKILRSNFLNYTWRYCYHISGQYTEASFKQEVSKYIISATPLMCAFSKLNFLIPVRISLEFFSYCLECFTCFKFMFLYQHFSMPIFSKILFCKFLLFRKKYNLKITSSFKMCHSIQLCLKWCTKEPGDIDKIALKSSQNLSSVFFHNFWQLQMDHLGLSYTSNSLGDNFQITGKLQISLSIQCMWMGVW